MFNPLYYETALNCNTVCGAACRFFDKSLDSAFAESLNKCILSGHRFWTNTILAIETFRNLDISTYLDDFKLEKAFIWIRHKHQSGLCQYKICDGIQIVN